MKKALIILGSIFFLSVPSHAWVSTEPGAKVYSFRFKMHGETFDYSQKAASYDQAFERAAQTCYKHFKKGKRLSESTGLDIIDVCANPRTI
ncbi:MAG: hypothetical protein ACK5P6_05410 [Pseudobdellovibrionaceae bacterium]